MLVKKRQKVICSFSFSKGYISIVFSSPEPKAEMFPLWQFFFLIFYFCLRTAGLVNQSWRKAFWVDGDSSLLVLFHDEILYTWLFSPRIFSRLSNLQSGVPRFGIANTMKYMIDPFFNNTVIIKLYLFSPFTTRTKRAKVR